MASRYISTSLNITAMHFFIEVVRLNAPSRIIWLYQSVVIATTIHYLCWCCNDCAYVVSYMDV